MKPDQLAPALILPLIAWRIYVRIRRNIGPQSFQPKRMVIWMVVFSVLTLLIALAGLTHPPTLTALAGGLLLGVPLALLGLRLTKFETTRKGTFYTPNTTIGVALSLLFVGRLAYRFMVLTEASAGRDPSLPQLFQSPLTFLFFGVTAGYYIAYYAGVLKRGRERK